MNNMLQMEYYRKIKNLQKNIDMYENILVRNELKEVSEYRDVHIELIRLRAKLKIAKLKIAKLPKEY